MSSEPTYTLTIYNETGKLQHFVLIALPDMLKPPPDPLSLVWLVGTAAGADPAGRSVAVMSWTPTCSVVLGQMREEKGFLTETALPVKVAASNSLIASYRGTFPGGKPILSIAYQAGKPGITVKTDGIPGAEAQARSGVTLHLGIALEGRAAMAIPLLPSQTYEFSTKLRYFLLAGSFAVGRAMVMADLPVYEVMFDGVTDRTVIFNRQEQFVPD